MLHPCVSYFNRELWFEENVPVKRAQHAEWTLNEIKKTFNEIFTVLQNMKKCFENVHFDAKIF